MARMVSGTACLAGEAGWPEWLAGRASTAGGQDYTRG